MSIAVENISVTYRNGHRALTDLSFRLESGTICGLVGVNGSGKSTLFNTLMGLVKPDCGEVKIGGGSIRKALKANRIAYVPQSEEIDWNFPILVEDVVMMGRYGKMNFLRIPSDLDHKRVDGALARVELTPFRHRQIGELSGGQKKRVFLARALAQESEILLLDEPFTGVDLKTENKIIDLLLQLKSEGYLILVSTHNLGSIPDFCDQVMLINQRLLAHGPTDQIYTQANLERAFGGALRQFSFASIHPNCNHPETAFTVLSDDERPAIFSGDSRVQALQKQSERRK